MGNALQAGCVMRPWGSEGRRRIKLMKTDGKVLKLKGPLYVKDILEGYPRHAIFDAGVVRRLGVVLSRPLHRNTELESARLYYIIPFEEDSDRASKTRRRLDELRALFSDNHGNSSEVNIVSSADVGLHTTRVKLRLRRQHLVASLASAAQSQVVGIDGNIVNDEHSVLTSLLPDSLKKCRNSSPGWKPALPAISEKNSPAAITSATPA
eukprot:Gb_33938 [translate_table: standard]